MTTALPIEINIFGNAKALTQLALETGQGHTAIKVLIEQLKNKKVKVDKVLPVSQWLGRLVDTRSKLQEIEQTIITSNLNDEEKQFLQDQVGIVRGPLKECEDLTYFVVSHLLHRIDKQHQSAIAKLDDYRNKRSEKNWKKFTKASDQLTQWTSMLPKKSNFINTVAQKKNVETLQQSALCLNSLAHSSSMEGDFLRILDFYITGKSSSEMIRTFVKSHHEKLSEDAKHMIDENIDSAPEHRFDDIQKYRSAYLHMVRKNWIAREKHLADEADRTRFCTHLHTYAGGPKDIVDPVAWSYNELPYLIPLIDIINSLMEKTTKRSSSKIDKCLKRNVSLGPTALKGTAIDPKALSLFRNHAT